MTSCFDHPKFKSSSARVQETCRSICYMLEAERFTARNAGRDGFTFRNARGLSVRIDPKIDACAYTSATIQSRPSRLNSSTRAASPTGSW